MRADRVTFASVRFIFFFFVFFFILTHFFFLFFFHFTPKAAPPFFFLIWQLCNRRLFCSFFFLKIESIDFAFSIEFGGAPIRFNFEQTFSTGFLSFFSYRVFFLFSARKHPRQRMEQFKQTSNAK